MRSCTGSVIFLSGLLAAGASLGAAAVPLETLVANPPFGSPGAAAGTPPAGSVEFRGWFTEGGEQFFSVYDPGRRRSAWLRAGETAGDLRVQGFDAARQVLAVEAGGQAQMLPLKSASVRATPPPAAGPAPAGGVAVVSAVGPGDSEEIRRADLALQRARQRQVLEQRQKLARERAAAARPAAPASP